MNVFALAEKVVHVSVISPQDMAMSAFLNRVTALGGYFVCSQQIITQVKSAIVTGNGKPQAQAQYIHNIQVPEKNFVELLRKALNDPKAVYSEFDLVPSQYFFPEP
jgi:hypothetical protein